MDVLNSDFRCKWPSKNNFSELDISQSLDWQCPSLSPYFLLLWFNKRKYAFVLLYGDFDLINASAPLSYSLATLVL